MARSRSTLVAMAAGAALTLGVGGAAVALGGGAFADSTPSPTATGDTQQKQPGQPGGWGKGHRHGGGGMDRRMGGDVLHGELVVRDGTGTATKKVLVQQGAVTAKSATSVTVKSTDGFTVAWAVTSTTRGTLTEVAVGDQVHVTGTRTADGAGTAEAIHEPGSRAPHAPDDAPRPAA
ncbi:MAG: hypothetical protein WAL50_07400 [Kineosporiaceae bacterium]|jgi:hypothetical protein